MKKNVIFKKYLPKPEYVFLLVMIIVGSTYALLVPAGGGPDEQSHIARSYAVAHGDFVAQEIGVQGDFVSPQAPYSNSDLVLYGSNVDKGLIDVSYDNIVRTQSKEKYSWQFPTWTDAASGTDKRVGRELTSAVYSNAAVNSPLVYSPYALGYWVGKVFTDNAYAVIIVMRLMGLVLSSLIVFASIKIVPFGKWVIVAIALTPIMIAEFSLVTADSLTFAVCIAFLACLLSFIASDHARSKSWISLGLTSVALGTVKLSYVPLVGLLVLIPIIDKGYWNKQAITKLGIILFFTASLFFVWYWKIRNINTGAMFGGHAFPSAQKTYIVNHLGVTLKIFIKRFLDMNMFSINDFGVIGIHNEYKNIAWVSILGIIYAVLYKDKRENIPKGLRKNSGFFFLVATGIFILISLLIILAIYLQFNAPGSTYISGVQSRYFTPILALLLIPAVVLTAPASYDQDISVRSSAVPIEQENGYLSCWIIVVLQIFMGVLDCFVLIHSLY
jgi:uncharacterized membrane protein